MSPFNNPSFQSNKGITLVELIISIVIISIAATALLQSLGLQARRNIDPALQNQALALAKSYMDEVLGKNFFEPTANPRLSTPIAQNNALIIASITDQTGRSTNPNNRQFWDNIYEYHNYTDQPKDLNGTVISSLSDYQISIDVNIDDTLRLDQIYNRTGCPPELMLITLTVTDPNNNTITLDSYVASYHVYTQGGCS